MLFLCLLTHGDALRLEREVNVKGGARLHWLTAPTLKRGLSVVRLSFKDQLKLE